MNNTLLLSGGANSVWRSLVPVTLLLWLVAGPASARSPIRLAEDPALSPDGRTLAFAWRGDLWTVPATGGVARALTQHPANDAKPCFSPDGRHIAFVSDREPGPQVFLMPATGGTPRAITAHSEGYTLEGWYPDGSALLVNAVRDYFSSPRATQRFFRIPAEPGAGEQLLFDDYGRQGDLSPDGRRLLFTREGEEWWRKGYRGSRSSQIWIHDLTSGQFEPVIREDVSARWPLWRPDGKGFYFTSARSGSFNLWECDLAQSQTNQLTRFDDDAVVFPCLSRDGRTLVFRHLFDLYRFQPGPDGSPVRIEIEEDADATRSPIERRTLAQATEVAFSDDGLEIAFIAGGDLWVMDTDLREPRPITDTPEEERDPTFSPDGQSILYVSDQGGQCDLWRAQRERPEQFWWQNDRFKLQRLTEDPAVEQDLQWSPDGVRIAFVKGLGDLHTLDPSQAEPSRRILPSWNKPDYQWSPDGKWFVVAVDDADFNSDIWVLPSDGSSPPVNISKHPDNEASPAWSPDGKMIAFTGRRLDTEVDIFYVWLGTEDDARTKRERTIEKAVEKMTKARNKEKARADRKEPGPATPAAKKDGGSDGDAAKADSPAADKTDKGEKVDKGESPKPEAREDGAKKARKLPAVTIDFDRIHERVRQISIPNSSESGLVWSHDSKKLAFTAAIDGKRGTYTVEFPDELKPKLLSPETGTQARWIETGNQIVWLSSGRADAPGGGDGEPPGRTGGVPASLTEAGKSTNFTFRAWHETDLPAKYRAAFDLAWRTMRDQWYDERLGNRNWDQIRRKYSDAAAAAPDPRALGMVINLMLGELNGSHLGFTPASSRAEAGAASPPNAWQPITAHLGVRWDLTYRGPGLKIRDLIPEGPADRRTNGLVAGEIVLSIDGAAVDPSVDLARLLNGPVARDIRLRVRDATGGERTVLLRPALYSSIRPLLYQKWIRDNRTAVDRLSDGTLGYLHIEGMNWPSFQKFERELYAAGSGKDGLIIDVRDNGGGSTADHLLTALTQPRHAVTVPRGGTTGYPQDRQVYAAWNKPVVVLCNQNSFSNAEIFSHAIKTLNRGKLVGVPTAGGVISTGGRPIMDVGFLRLPFRGWFLPGTGEDMELNGAVPDIIVWPRPGDLPRGQDEQLEKAVSVLRDDVAAWKNRPQPTPRKSSERPRTGGQP